MKRLLAALAVACALAVSACVPKDGSPGTSSQGWHQIAVGVGQVVGTTKADAKIQKTVDTLYQYCGTLQTVAALGTVFAPEKQRKAAEIAAAAINGVCNSPPTGDLTAVQAALTTAVKAYEAVVAVQKTAPTT